jgi:hypothetical protein
MNFAALLIAVIPAALAVTLHVCKVWPRFAAVTGGLAIPFLIAGIPPLLHLVGHPLSPGLAMVAALAAAVGALVFLALEFFVKDHHKKRLLGRKGEPHHWRAQYATATLAVAALMIVGSWGAVRHEISHGWSQTWSSTNGPGA